MVTKPAIPDLSLDIKTIHRALRIPIPINNQINAIALEEKLTWTSVSLSLLQRGMTQYVHKKGRFHCQACSNSFPNKKMHLVPIGFEEFIFCDDCFFSEAYKDFIRKIL